MTKLDIELHETVVSVINKIKSINDTGIELVIPTGAVLLENISNLKLIKEVSNNLELEVSFTTEDPYGQNLIDSLEEKVGLTTNNQDSEDMFVPNVTEKKVNGFLEQAKAFKVPTLTNPFKNMSFKGNDIVSKLGIILGVLVPIILYILVGLKFPKASVKLTVGSRPHTRSVTVRVSSSNSSDAKNKILKGYPVTTTMDSATEIKTTGTSIIGDKAEGSATIYNSTSAAVTIKKGSTLTYKDKDKKEFQYVTKKEVVVPAAIANPKIDTEPTIPTIASSVDADIEASSIGDTYNIDDKKSLAVKNQKSSEIYGYSKGKITGGKSETITVVSKTDIQSAKDTLTKQDAEAAESTIKKTLTSVQKLISGSIKITAIKETFSAKEGEKASALTINRTSNVDALVYTSGELKQFVDNLMTDLVPSGYELLDKVPTIGVTILGNSSSSVVSSTEADIEVTVKAIVVPTIDKEKIKEDLKGLTPEQAQEIISQVKNVKTYEFKISPVIPFFKKVPKDKNRIDIQVEIV